MNNVFLIHIFRRQSVTASTNNAKETKENESDDKQLSENDDLFHGSVGQTAPLSRFPIGCLVKTILKSGEVDNNGLGTVIKVYLVIFSPL